jgi:hypothetical protein
MMRGCPAYLGCLWNATDIDLDKVTASILSIGKEDDLSAILQSCRSSCSYPHLNGSSIVVYGMPSRVLRF